MPVTTRRVTLPDGRKAIESEHQIDVAGGVAIQLIYLYVTPWLKFKINKRTFGLNHWGRIEGLTFTD